MNASAKLVIVSGSGVENHHWVKPKKKTHSEPDRESQKWFREKH